MAPGSRHHQASGTEDNSASGQWAETSLPLAGLGHCEQRGQKSWEVGGLVLGCLPEVPLPSGFEAQSPGPRARLSSHPAPRPPPASLGPRVPTSLSFSFLPLPIGKFLEPATDSGPVDFPDSGWISPYKWDEPDFFPSDQSKTLLKFSYLIESGFL